MTGMDFEENIEQLAWEQKKLEELGLPKGTPEVLAGHISQKEIQTDEEERQYQKTDQES